jgi:hypothetical protein
LAPFFLGIAQKKIKEKPQLPFHFGMEVDIEVEVGVFSLKFDHNHQQENI